MSEKAEKLLDEKLAQVSGGEVNPPWSIGMKPKHDDEICPDCGVCYLHFEQFQTYNGVREEVDYCPNCGWIKFKV